MADTETLRADIARIQAGLAAAGRRFVEECRPAIDLLNAVAAAGLTTWALVLFGVGPAGIGLAMGSLLKGA